MRMTDLHVERFGAWHDLHLPLPETGLNILYGPNEAGKSTLMRFVRAMLYGFVAEPVAWQTYRLLGLSGGAHVSLCVALLQSKSAWLDEPTSDVGSSHPDAAEQTDRRPQNRRHQSAMHSR